MIVKYNNDMNYMPLPNFTGRQHDLFFSIISQIQDKHSNSTILKRFFDPNSRQLIIPYEQFVKLCRATEWNRSFIEIYKEIESFLKLLIDYKVSYRTPRSFYTFVCFEEAEHDTIEQTIKITFQKRFYDMIINFKLGFTRFELAEFITLNGKYTKTLYRLLKQFRHTGILTIKWEDFIQIMDIPITYRQIDIDNRILKPAIKELTKEYNLLDSQRTPFKRLSYKKIKQGGNKVVKIEFCFSPEPQYKDMQIPKMTKKESLIETLNKNFVNNYVYSNNSNEMLKIEAFNINEKDNKIIEAHFYSYKEEKPLQQNFSLKQYAENDILIMFQNAVVTAQEMKNKAQDNTDEK